jgi:hypothetical protein
VRALTLLLVMLVAAALIAEALTPRVIEGRVEQAVAAAIPQAADVAAVVGDTPFLPPLLTEGHVASLDVRLRDVATPAVTVAAVDFAFEDVVLDRRALLRRELVVHDLGAGRVRAEVAAEDLVAALDLPTDRLPDAVTDAIDVEAGLIELAGRAAGSVRLPEGLLPCDPAVTVRHAVVELTCEVSELPPILRDLDLA